MAKRLIKKAVFGTVHLQALAFLVLYFIFSNFVFVKLVTHPNNLISIAGPFVFGIVSGVVFLYLFSHRDFFSFIGNIEKEEKSKEKIYLKKFGHYGKIIACIIISAVAGPIFLALSVRFLFPKSANRYLIVIFCTIVSSIFAVLFAKGMLTFL